MASVTDRTVPLVELLPPDNPASWPQADIHDLLALSHRDYFPLQVAALRLRFEQLGGAVAALEKLARRQKVTKVDSIADALPLFFDHRVYKSYPLAIIEQRDLAKLTGWLDRLTTHDLSKMSLDGLATIDGWLARLDEFGMLVGHSTGTTGKLSFIPRSRAELPAWKRAYNEGNRATTGVDPESEPVTTFFPGYRGGHHMMLKMLNLFGVPAAGGPEHFHTLYPSYISADLSSLAGRMQSAEDRGELDRLGLDPALIEARQALIEQGRRRKARLQADMGQAGGDPRVRRRQPRGLAEGGDGLAAILRVAMDHAEHPPEAGMTGMRVQRAPDERQRVGGPPFLAQRDRPVDEALRIGGRDDGHGHGSPASRSRIGKARAYNKYVRRPILGAGISG